MSTDMQTSPHQINFEQTYITSSEITERFQVSRTHIFIAVCRGQLPPPIRLNKKQSNSPSIWLRTEVEENLQTIFKKSK